MGKVAGNNANWNSFPQAQCPTGTWNDCLSSAFNNGNVDGVRLWEDAGYTGGNVCLSLGSTIVDMGGLSLSNGDPANDRISSNSWVSNTGCSL
jgi:hypothetical protein